MTKTEKIHKIQRILETKILRENLCEDLLKEMGDLKNNYGDYMITEPIDCEKELERVSDADYELCTALLSMLLKEEHRIGDVLKEGTQMKEAVQVLLERMIEVLQNGLPFRVEESKRM